MRFVNFLKFNYQYRQILSSMLYYSKCFDDITGSLVHKILQGEKEWLKLYFLQKISRL